MISLSCYNLFLYKGDVVNVIATTRFDGVLLPVVRSEWDGATYIAFAA